MNSMTGIEIAHRLHPALRHLTSARADLSPDAIGAARESLNQRRRASARALDTAGVEIADDVVRLGSPRSTALRIYRGGRSPAPAVIYCHAGAFVLGNLDTDHRQCVEFAKRAHCTVISVDYRLAPEDPYPAAFDDVLAVLRWAADHAGELRIDPSRLAVAGSSAGAALAAGLAQQAADGSAPPIVFQLLHQPVLDDRPMPSKDEFVATPGFEGPATELMWHHYLASEPVQTHAVPARRGELTGVASALITCSELDPLRDEAVDYALRLMWAGVATELHVFPGTCHGFDSLLPDWEISQELFAIQGAALRRALHPSGDA